MLVSLLVDNVLQRLGGDVCSLHTEDTITKDWQWDTEFCTQN
jgi:hypothetical protein